jgi:transcriptional regulator with XRE-family HTH domain
MVLLPDRTDSRHNISHDKETGEWLGRPFGAAVRARRMEMGLTQERLAVQAGMSQGALSRLERGKGVPTLHLLERLAAAMASNLLISLSPSGEVCVAFRAPTAASRFVSRPERHHRRLPVRDAPARCPGPAPSCSRSRIHGEAGPGRYPPG